MTISTRTPEGDPNRCPICGKEVRLEPSVNATNTADAPCPHCGCLMWFHSRVQAGRDNLDLVAIFKQRLRDWIKHISKLSKSATDPDAFYQEMLTGLVEVLAAHGGAIWTRGPERPWLQCGVGIGSEEIADRHLWQPSHYRLLERAFAEGRPTAIKPIENTESAEENGNSTQSLVLLSPVKKGTKAVALVEIFQRTGSSPVVQGSYLRFLTQICELAGRSTAIGGENAGA